jgi:putative intracellular protease/amidase
MSASSVKFEGKGPFYLRTVEHATASVLANTIQVTLFALVDGKGQTLVQIETQMTPGAAEELANALLRAADKAAPEIGGKPNGSFACRR